MNLIKNIKKYSSKRKASLKSNVASDTSLTEATRARAEHPLYILILGKQCITFFAK